MKRFENIFLTANCDRSDRAPIAASIASIDGSIETIFRELAVRRNECAFADNGKVQGPAIEVVGVQGFGKKGGPDPMKGLRK